MTIKSPDSKRKLSTADKAAKLFHLRIKPEPASIIASVLERKQRPISGRARIAYEPILPNEIFWEVGLFAFPDKKHCWHSAVGAVYDRA
jgi:hypothetical protein